MEQIAEEARKAREGKDEKVKKKKLKKKKRRKGKKRKKTDDGRKLGGKDGDGPAFKRRKPGKLGLDWPYKTGTRLLLSCISCLSQDPDENFNSRAFEYFDVQSMAILEQLCKLLDTPLPDSERPTQYGETLVIMALNLSDWIAKYVTMPAQEIPDEKVDEFLALRGVIPQEKKKAKDVPKSKGKGKNKETEAKPEPEKPTTPPRVWDEMKSPVYIPSKTRKSKRKPLEEEEFGEGYDTEAEVYEKNEWVEEEEATLYPQTLEDVKRDFLEYLMWYNPEVPEFMYLGPKTIPNGVDMFKIYDAENDDVPDDLRELNWTIIEHKYEEQQSLIPYPVPQYYPTLRPLRPIRVEDFEKSQQKCGSVRESPDYSQKQNLRFYSPWYIMNPRLKVTIAFDKEEIEEEVEEAKEKEIQGEGAENEEEFQDEKLSPSGPPPEKNSLWGDCKMREQLEILCHLLHLTISFPELTIEYVFELLEEFCAAVECAEKDEHLTEENNLIRKKRTIILERYYLQFFGKKFRDYNEKTPDYMRVICSRLAYYIQLLYTYTSKTLWEFQSQPNVPPPRGEPEEPADDPQALRDWDDWIAWLLRVTRTCDEWASWISDTVEEAERKAMKKKGEYVGPDGKIQRLTKEEWVNWKDEVEEKTFEYRSTRKVYNKQSLDYELLAKNILPVKHRPVRKLMEELEEEAEEDEGEEDENVWEEKTESGAGDFTRYGIPPDEEPTETEETTEDETEYEDLTENDN